MLPCRHGCTLPESETSGSRPWRPTVTSLDDMLRCGARIELSLHAQQQSFSARALPMPLVDVAELAPTRRLLQVAASDTGQSRRVADFLLAWWNAGSCGGFDLTELWTVDDAIAADMLATVASTAARRGYLNAFGLGPGFKWLLVQWRPRLNRPSP